MQMALGDLRGLSLSSTGTSFQGTNEEGRAHGEPQVQDRALALQNPPASEESLGRFRRCRLGPRDLLGAVGRRTGGEQGWPRASRTRLSYPRHKGLFSTSTLTPCPQTPARCAVWAVLGSRLSAPFADASPGPEADGKDLEAGERP